VTGAAVALAVFVIALAGGFLAGHDPRPGTVAIRLEPPAEPSTEVLHQGVVSSAADGTLEVSTAGGAQRFDLAAETPIEELTPLGEDGSALQGVPVNLGGERTNNGYVLTGIVVFEVSQ